MRFLIVAGIAALTLSSCSISKELRETPNPPFAISKNKNFTPLLVFSFQHHTGIVLPRKAVESELPELTTELSGAWLEFGFLEDDLMFEEEIAKRRNRMLQPEGNQEEIEEMAKLLNDFAKTCAHE